MGKICPEGIAAAKRKFDRYPCVSMDSLALTKSGWREYKDLKVGEEICTYNITTKYLEWKPIIKLHHYKDSPVIRIHTPRTNFSFICTENHKWVLKQTWKSERYSEELYWQKDFLVETKDIHGHMELITGARLSPKESNDDLDLYSFCKNNESWVGNVIKMSHAQREAYFASAIVFDGCDKILDARFGERTNRYGFSQKNQDHGDSVEICAILLGYRVSNRVKKCNSSMRDWTIIRRTTQSTQNLMVSPEPDQDVWCPETENSTWVMKQGGMITITGNSAYANMFASKYCQKIGKKKKDSGGSGKLAKWRKEKWVRISTSGEVKGACGTSKDKKNPDRCLPMNKAKSLSKSERATTAKRKKSLGKNKQFVSNTDKAKVRLKR